MPAYRSDRGPDEPMYLYQIHDAMEAASRQAYTGDTVIAVQNLSNIIKSLLLLIEQNAPGLFEWEKPDDRTEDA